MFKLYQLGWTQEEIGEKVGLTQQAISEITKNLILKKFVISMNGRGTSKKRRDVLVRLVFFFLK